MFILHRFTTPFDNHPVLGYCMENLIGSLFDESIPLLCRFLQCLEVIIFGHGLLSICIKLSKLYAAIYCLHGSVLLFCLNFLISKFMKWN